MVSVQCINYFRADLLAWEENLDIQPVFNHYKVVMYMCAYLAEIEDDCSHAMNQAFNETVALNLSNYDQIKSIDWAYSMKRECNVHEAVYHTMSELCFQKSFPAVVFTNTNIPEKCFTVCFDENKIKDLPENSTDIFKKKKTWLIGM